MSPTREQPTVERLGEIGALHRADGRPFAAEPFLRGALERAEVDYAHDPVRLAGRLNELGVLYKDLARYDEARALYERALALLDDAPGSHARSVATLYHNLGGIEHARGDYAVAEAFARHGLTIRRGCGAPADEVAADMVALAAILDGLEEHEEAERLYCDALDILQQDPDAHALDVAVALNDLGASYAKRDLYVRARNTLRSALALKRRILHDLHPDLAVTLNNLAWVEERNGEPRTAAALYDEALAILTAALGPHHPKTVTCRKNAERLGAR